MNVPGTTKTIHHHFADFICNKYNCHDDVLKAIIFCTSYFTASGHSCLSLETIANKTLKQIMYDENIDVDDVTFPDIDILEKYLLECDVVTQSAEKPKPLVYVDGNCYLYRYFTYENIILSFFAFAQEYSIDDETIAQCSKTIDNLQTKGITFSDEQILAQITALTNRLCVISGGPGTGKTTVIAAIVYQLLRTHPECAIALCAPTGKAASRLMQALAYFKDTYVENNRTIIFPDQSFTIHRLLGYQKDALEFYYNEKNPLPYDVIIVDECSMVDIPLVAKLIKALKFNARLILVGDKDQLSSVEAGAFFGDICWGASNYSYTDTGKELLRYCNCSIDNTMQKSNPVRDTIVILNKTFRFSADSGIATLAKAIRNNDEKAVLDVLQNNFGDVEFKEYDSLDWLYTTVQEYTKTCYSDVIGQTDIDKAFQQIANICILTPFNKGPWGVVAYNTIIEKQLKPSINDEWYHGRVVMVTANNYNLEVYNGDTGIYNGNDNMVYFKTADGFRKIHTSLLSDYMPAYSITVHKSQGSEFNHVVLILPHIDIAYNEHWKMLLTRELLYTAVTRARKHLTILGNKQIVLDMMKNPTKRTSGIRQRLWVM
ncbi:MAG: exodeoxyribonuclease V subunit alpha [Spirochaetota bacterium]